jgi:membrane-bound serine protease (ClpP class)
MTKRGFLLFILMCCISIFAFSNEKKIYYLKLHAEIDKGASRLINKGVEEAERQKADIFVLDLNTFGGLLDAADEIRSKLLNTKMTTVVWINNNAASAGALISIACDSIYMIDGANIGAATVVDQEGNKAPDKYQSYMRSLMRSTAETNGRNPKIAEAMVDEDVAVPGIKDTGKILTFTTQEALHNHYCDAVITSKEKVFERAAGTSYTLAEHQETTIDKIISFLLNPFVNSILIMMIIGGIYFELKMPGIGLPTIVAIIGAIAYFAPLYLEGLAANWEILLFIIGIILLLLEIFVIPGFGVAGVAGIACVLAGLILSLIGNTEFGLPGGIMEAIGPIMFRVTITILIGFTLLFTLGGSVFNFPIFNKMVLTTDQKSDEGYTIKQNEHVELIGRTGVAITDLRPSGKVEIEDNIYDTIADAEFIVKGENVVVIKVEGYSVKVKKVKNV